MRESSRKRWVRLTCWGLISASVAVVVGEVAVAAMPGQTRSRGGGPSPFVVPRPGLRPQAPQGLVFVPSPRMTAPRTTDFCLVPAPEIDPKFIVQAPVMDERMIASPPVVGLPVAPSAPR